MLRLISTDEDWTLTLIRVVLGFRASLDRIGIENRAPVQTPDGWVLHVYDSGSHLEGKIAEVAQAYGTHYMHRQGRGEFVGGDTREAGAAVFRDIIGKRTFHSAQDRAGGWSGDRDLLGAASLEDGIDLPAAIQELMESYGTRDGRAA